MSRSEAAIKRGQTGFLKKRIEYEVVVTMQDGDVQTVVHNGFGKGSMGGGSALAKNTQDECSYYFGDAVALTVDGKEVPDETLANNHHAPKEL